MENPTYSFRETNLELQLIQELQIKSKAVMSWSSRKKKRAFFVPFILSKGNLIKIVFYLNVQCIECTFRIYILLPIKKHSFIHFCRLFLKSSKACSASLMKKLSLRSIVFQYVIKWTMYNSCKILKTINILRECVLV